MNDESTMKRIFKIVVAVGGIAMCAACRNSADSGSAGVTVDSDSILEACRLGESMGYAYGLEDDEAIETLIEEMPELDFSVDRYIEGVTTALRADSANLSYLVGLKAGNIIMRDIQVLRQAGVEIDRDMLLSMLENYLLHVEFTPEDSVLVAATADSLLHRAIP